MTKIGKTIKNNNGKEYKIILVKDNKALLHGGYDFVVINDLDHFEEFGCWHGGNYFPCFDDEDSYDALMSAIHCFQEDI